MSIRREATSRILVDGKPMLVNIIENPTIDDVVNTEARLFAAEVANPGTVPEGRRVSRDIRDFLIRLNVER